MVGTAATDSCHLLTGTGSPLPNGTANEAREWHGQKWKSLTLIVSSARSKTAHCLGVRLLVSSLTIWSCKQSLYLLLVCHQMLQEEIPISSLSLDSCCGYMATALAQPFMEYRIFYHRRYVSESFITALVENKHNSSLVGREERK